jgi:phosphoribosylformimino-5-aminoimidazole carboxamide ribotide isomerase
VLEKDHAHGRISGVRIIPVIDLRAGRAVRGAGGERDHYRPVRSRLGGRSWADLSSPTQLLAVYRRTLRPEEIYVADLDRIGGATGDNDAAISDLLAADADLRLLFDGGFAGAADLRRAPRHGRLVPVVGTETLASIDDLAGLASDRAWGPPVLSLDLDEAGLVSPHAAVARAGEREILRAAAAAGLRTVILLFLRRVGRACGLPASRLEDLVRAAAALRILAGGGVGSLADLSLLRDAGVDGALVATALHDGRIVPEDLEAAGFLAPAAGRR